MTRSKWTGRRPRRSWQRLVPGCDVVAVEDGSLDTGIFPVNGLLPAGVFAGLTVICAREPVEIRPGDARLGWCAAVRADPCGAKKFFTRGQASYLLRSAPQPVGIVTLTRSNLVREHIED